MSMDYRKTFKEFDLNHLIPGGKLDYYEAIDILIERSKKKISPDEALNIDICLDEIREGV